MPYTHLRASRLRAARWIGMGLLAWGLQAPVLAQTQTGASLRIRGSTTFLPFVQSVAEEAMVQESGLSVTVAGGGTYRGFKALLDDTADLAVTSGPIPDNLEKEFARRGIRLRHHTVGYRPIAVAVHPALPVASLTRIEVRAIFSGAMTHWPSAVGETAQRIDVLVGPPSGGLTQLWRELIFQDNDTFPASARVLPQGERVKALAGAPWGVTFLAMDGSATTRLKHLSVDGVSPDSDNVASGRYPLRTPLVLVMREPPPPAVDRFLQRLNRPSAAWDLGGMVLAGKRP